MAKPSASLQILLALSAALLTLGALSSHWFVDDASPHTTDHLGLLADEVCGAGGGRADALEDYATEMRTGVRAPARPWTCERDLNVLGFAEIRNARDFALLTIMFLGLVAGLATAVTCVVACVGRIRARRWVTIGAAVALVAGAGVVAALIGLGETHASELGYGAGAYAIGAILALVVARRLPVTPA